MQKKHYFSAIWYVLIIKSKSSLTPSFTYIFQNLLRLPAVYFRQPATQTTTILPEALCQFRDISAQNATQKRNLFTHNLASLANSIAVDVLIHLTGALNRSHVLFEFSPVLAHA